MMNSQIETQEWNSWNNEVIKKMGESYKKRATGELPEKEASKSFVNLMIRKGLYQKRDSLLDIGGACGHFFRSFHDRLDQKIDYTVCDAIFNFLKAGKDIYAGKPNIDFIQCDALKLPFKENSFDTVIVNLFHFFPQLDVPLRQALRVAKKRVLWRTPIGEYNYIIKMINENDYKKVGIIFPEGSYDHTLCMMYTKKYLQDLISDLGYDLDFIEKDEDYEDFDNNQFDEFQLPSSKAIAGCQIHGNLIMDWHYVNIVHRNK